MFGPGFALGRKECFVDAPALSDGATAARRHLQIASIDERECDDSLSDRFVARRFRNVVIMPYARTKPLIGVHQNRRLA
jgi:hypothetical protein